MISDAIRTNRPIFRINYLQGDESRFIKGPVVQETDDFIEIELHNYITKIYKKYIVKVEVEKPDGGRF